MDTSLVVGQISALCMLRIVEVFMSDWFCHDNASVEGAVIGRGTRIWQYSIVLPGAKIGAECNICSHCFVESQVTIGDRVTVKNGVYLWDGIAVEEDVFIGPNVSFTNDKFPRSRDHSKPLEKTHIGKGASIGAGAVILPGLTIGRFAMIAAGAVVTRSVPPKAIVKGNPARITGYVDTSTSSRSWRDVPSAVAAEDTHLARLISLRHVTDLRGSLVVGEVGAAVPFEIKRFFVVHAVPSIETRGEHAHKECHQFLVCVSGSVSVVTDDGVSRREYTLSGPQSGLYIPARVWGIQYRYSSDASLLVFASHFYDPDDYIREYEQFIDYVAGGTSHDTFS